MTVESAYSGLALPEMGEALARDGQGYFAMNRLAEAGRHDGARSLRDSVR
jgi:hypothetical protein